MSERSDEEQVVDQLYELAHLRGIKPAAARDAIERSRDKRALLRRWRRAHQADSRRIVREIDDAAHQRMVEESERAHAVVRDGARQERERARSRMRLGQRLDVALAEAQSLSGVSAVSFGDVISKGAAESSVPRGGPAIEGLETHLFVIRARVEMIEADLDHYQGLVPARQTSQMSTEDKDAMIVSQEMEGHTPEEISEAYPFLGSPLTISRKRREHGLKTKDGTVNPKSIYARAEAATETKAA